MFITMNLTIPLPDEGKCLLKNGQKVDFDTPFFEIKKDLEKEIGLTEKLKVPPKKIFKYLKKFVGDQVAKDEIIAVKKTFFSDIKYASEYQGIITEVNHEKGIIILKIQDEKEIVKKCYFKGEVKEVKKNAVLLEIKEKEEFSLKKCALTTGGEIIYLKEIGSETTSELEGKIVVIKEISDINLSKIEVLGAKGVVTLMKPLETKSDLPFFQLKNEDSFEMIVKHQFPSCLTDTVTSRIIFYR